MLGLVLNHTEICERVVHGRQEVVMLVTLDTEVIHERQEVVMLVSVVVNTERCERVVRGRKEVLVVANTGIPHRSFFFPLLRKIRCLLIL